MILFIIYIIIAAVIFYVLLKVLGKVWKAILITFLFTLIILGIVVFFVYKDIKYMTDSPKLTILESNGKIQTGYIIQKDIQESLTQEKLAQINGFYEINDLESIKEDKYLLIIINAEIFNELPDVIEFRNITLETQNLILALNAETSDDFLNELGIYQDELGIISLNEEKLIENKAGIAGIMLKNIAEDPQNIINHLKNEKIKIYPKLFILTLLNQIPTSFLESKLKAQIAQIET